MSALDSADWMRIANPGEVASPALLGYPARIEANLRSTGTAAVSAALALLLYLDRICMAEIGKAASFRPDSELAKRESGWILSAFSVAYAFALAIGGALAWTVNAEDPVEIL